jgi:hypothetical protein
VFFVAAGFGGVVNTVEDTRWGSLLNISNLIGTVWVSLFEGSDPQSNGALFFRVSPFHSIPLWSCWLALAAICAGCVYLLARKIRAVEVVG